MRRLRCLVPFAWLITLLVCMGNLHAFDVTDQSVDVTMGTPRNITLLSNGGSSIDFTNAVVTSSGGITVSVARSGSHNSTLTITTSGPITTATTVLVEVTASDGSATATGIITVTVNLRMTAAAIPAQFTVGVNHVIGLSASGGSGTIQFRDVVFPTISQLTISGGLSGANSATLTVITSGTFAAAKLGIITVTAFDTAGASITVTVNVTVNIPVTVNASATAAATTGTTPQSVTMSSSGGTGTITLSVGTPVLTGTLTMAAPGLSGGLLTMTPTGGTGTATFRVTGTDQTTGTPATGFRDVVLTVNGPVVVNANATAVATTATIPQSVTVSSSGGTGTVTLTVGAPTLTGTLTMAAPVLSGGTLTMTSTSGTGTATYRVTGTDQTAGTPATGFRDIVLTVNGPVVVSANATAVETAGTIAQSVTMNGSGGTGTVTLTVGSTPTLTGTLTMAPPALSGGGILTMTPTGGTGTATYRVTGTDQTNGTHATGFLDVTLTVHGALVVIANATVVGTTGTIPQTVMMTSSGGTGTVTMTVAIQSKSAGLTVVTPPVFIGGILTMTPTSGTGTVVYRVTGTDQTPVTPATSFRDITLTVNPSITSTPVTRVTTVGAPAQSTTLVVTGGTGVVSYSAPVVSGAPAGLTVTPTLSGLTNNTLSLVTAGTVATATPVTITVTATDTVGATGTVSVTLTVNPAIVTVPITAVTTLGVEKPLTLSATGGTGTIRFGNAVVAGAPVGLTVTPSLSGTNNTTLKLNSSGSITAAVDVTITVTATDDASATATIITTLTVNPSLLISVPADHATLLAYTGATGSDLAITLTLLGGTGAITVSTNTDFANVSQARSVAVDNVAHVVTVTPGTQTGDFALVLTAVDTLGARSVANLTIRISAPLAWATGTAPNGAITVVSLGAGSARTGKLDFATTGGQNNPTLTASGLPTYLSASRTDNNATLSVTLAPNAIGIPTTSASSTVQFTITDGVGTLTASVPVLWFVNQHLHADPPLVLAYPLVNPAYASVLGNVTYLDPASAASAPDLLASVNETPLTITCTRVLGANSAWEVGQDQLLCRSTQTIFVSGDQVRLGATNQVARWQYDTNNGVLTITAMPLAAGGGLALLNQLTACIAYTNPAGSFTTDVDKVRQVAVSITACTARGVNLGSDALIRTIQFTSQPPAFDQVVVEPGGRARLTMSFTPAADMTCSVNLPKPAHGKVVNVNNVEVGTFTLNEVKEILGGIYYLNTDSTTTSDPISLTVSDTLGTILGDNIIVPVRITDGDGLTVIGDPLPFLIPNDDPLLPVGERISQWSTVVTGPSGIFANATIVPWFGVSGTAVAGVTTSAAPIALGGKVSVAVTFDWTVLGTTVTDGTTTTITYPAFLRFRLRVQTSDATVEQPCLVRILAPTVPRSVQITAPN
jgi:hypothetical protein